GVSHCDLPIPYPTAATRINEIDVLICTDRNYLRQGSLSAMIPTLYSSRRDALLNCYQPSTHVNFIGLR
ncbi:hypothetical protein KAQ80_03415, partial [Candidatus Bipolaricaulota bacterium]|nr:hypothetical protein [Candidatus Bipolaricaulota bacterium]